jgi:hypothetical protein
MTSLLRLAKTMITGDHAEPLPETRCYPGMLLKRKTLAGFEREDSATSPEDQPAETQAFSGFQGLARVAGKKDVRKATSEARMSFRINTRVLDILQCR